MNHLAISHKPPNNLKAATANGIPLANAHKATVNLGCSSIQAPIEETKSPITPAKCDTVSPIPPGLLKSLTNKSNLDAKPPGLLKLSINGNNVTFILSMK